MIFILAGAYKRSRKCLDFQVKSENGAILALTLRLRRRGKFALPRYHADLIGGKGGTRTFDPGIMSKRPLMPTMAHEGTMGRWDRTYFSFAAPPSGVLRR